MEKLSTRDKRIYEEKESLLKIRQYMENQDDIKSRQQEAMRLAFMRTNELQKEHHEAKRISEELSAKNDKLDYFPFVSGEKLESHKKGLNE
jgi:hypothetical protein